MAATIPAWPGSPPDPGPEVSRETACQPPSNLPDAGLSPGASLAAFGLAVLTFHLAYGSSSLAWLIVLFPYGLLPLTRLGTARRAFYMGLLLGLALYGPQLGFFWTIFGAPAVALWSVLALWPGVFLGLVRSMRPACGTAAMLVLVPLFWTGTEYFRSELYYLRFSWLTPGYAWAGDSPMGLIRWAGVYGTGTLLFAAAALFWFLTGWRRWMGPVLTLLLVALDRGHVVSETRPRERELRVAGAQIESLDDAAIPRILERLLHDHPVTDLVVLPEYSLTGAPTREILDWCRQHRRHLVIGGVDRLARGGFRNTAWVVGPEGTVVFRQGKSVPIQFFDDGLPAADQSLWESPWGLIGIAVCYDLSYTRVMDRLVRQGAEALIVPTMDAASWGRSQHALHARIAPARSAEYGLPIVRCASSGVSQITDRDGRIIATAPFSPEVQTFAGTIRLAGRGSLPPDRWLAPIAVLATVGLPLARGIRTALGSRSKGVNPGTGR